MTRAGRGKQPRPALPSSVRGPGSLVVMVAETPEITVRDNAESQTYDALIGDQVVGTIVYERSGQRLVFSHTIVEPEFRGRGIGTVLVTKALDDVRARGMTLTNYCEFVASFIAAHPDYADLIDAEHPGHPRRH
jgi:predicted GNAT family acetyltransferase